MKEFNPAQHRVETASALEQMVAHRSFYIGVVATRIISEQLSQKQESEAHGKQKTKVYRNTQVPRHVLNEIPMLAVQLPRRVAATCPHQFEHRDQHADRGNFEQHAHQVNHKKKPECAQRQPETARNRYHCKRLD